MFISIFLNQSTFFQINWCDGLKKRMNMRYLSHLKNESDALYVFTKL